MSFGIINGREYYSPRPSSLSRLSEKWERNIGKEPEDMIAESRQIVAAAIAAGKIKLPGSVESLAQVSSKFIAEGKCGQCGRSFKGHGNSRYCSHNCKRDAEWERYKSGQKATDGVPCVICGAPRTPKTTAKTCSPECSAEQARRRYKARYKKQK